MLCHSVEEHVMMPLFSEKRQCQLPVKEEDCQFFTQVELTVHFSHLSHAGSSIFNRLSRSLCCTSNIPFTAVKPKQLVSAGPPARTSAAMSARLYPLLAPFPRAHSQRFGSATRFCPSYRYSFQQYTRPAHLHILSLA